MMSAPIVHERTFTPEAPRELFRALFLYAWNMRTYDVARDGRFLMVSRGEDVEGAESARIVLNWFEELERLVPTDN